MLVVAVRVGALPLLFIRMFLQLARLRSMDAMVVAPRRRVQFQMTLERIDAAYRASSGRPAVSVGGVARSREGQSPSAGERVSATPTMYANVASAAANASMRCPRVRP